MDLFLRVDGQNFDNTIADSDELSTLRGGGLAMLYAPQRLFEYLKGPFPGLKPVYHGASEGLAQIPLDEDEDPEKFASRLRDETEKYLAGLTGPDDDPGKKIRPFLTFSVAVGWGEDSFKKLNKRLINQNRQAQLQQLTLDCLPPDSDNPQSDCRVEGQDPPGPVPCKIDHVRPAAGWIQKGGDPPFQVSHSVCVRQRYGRKLRQQLYAQELGALDAQEWKGRQDILDGILSQSDTVRFADSFEEIATPPEEQKVPEKLQNKMAVLHLDGNGFGAIRKAYCNTPEALSSFSELVLDRRRRLLGKVLEEVCGVQYKKDGETVIPLETLLWGGDEACWVMPAWSIIKVLENLEPLLNDGQWAWTPPGGGTDIQLTHALGLVICHYKTPIRQARALARELAEHAKELKDQNGNTIGRKACYLQYMLLMGVDPPDRDLTDFRQKVYGLNQASAFTLGFRKGDFANTLCMIRKLKGFKDSGEAVPLGQLYRLRQLAVEMGLLDGNASEEAKTRWEKKADEILGRYRKPDGKPFCWGDMKDANLCYDPGHPAMPLFHILDLWYCVDRSPCDPFRGDNDAGRNQTPLLRG